MAEEETPQRATVSLEETRLCFEVPATAINKFYLHAGPTGFRLTLAETNPETGTVSMRSAVLMHPQDAIALKNLLSETLLPIEEQIKAFAQSSGRQNG